MSGKKKMSVWEKEIYYLLVSSPDEFSNGLSSLPCTFIENMVNSLLTDKNELLDVFNAKINDLKSNMNLPNARYALRKLDVVAKITGALGYFDALVELSGKWDDLKPHINSELSKGNSESVNFLIISCQRFADDFKILIKEKVMDKNDDGSLVWKWKKTALGEYFYHYNCHQWRLIEKAFNTKYLKQLISRHMEQQRGKFSSDYERLRTLLGLPSGKIE
jgi:hypothetical protein